MELIMSLLVINYSTDYCSEVLMDLCLMFSRHWSYMC